MAIRNAPLRRRRFGAAVAMLVAASSLAGTPARTAPLTEARRAVEPVVLTGAAVPRWSRLPATGVARPYPSGALDGVRDAHNGTLVVPPDTRGGVRTGSIAAFAWKGGHFVEIPVQVDQRFPYFLANGRSAFGFYSGTDEELTYQWDTESWKKIGGRCRGRYPHRDPSRLEGYPTADPVQRLDDDDEIVFMASDAGARAPSATKPPPGARRARYEIRLVDPLRPASPTFVYLFLRPGGSSFTAGDGYVRYRRDVDADEWIDRRSFSPNDPGKLGTSNTEYGPNLEGTVCDPDGTVRRSRDRFLRDGVTVTTDAYRFHASGRWMIRQVSVARPGTPGVYGPDLIDRWKGRAFQQSPDSKISVVGVEDEQVNWEANSSLLGELAGPVRAIREVWGADSGTNVTKTETFYRDAITYRYRLRVHPIPPDGLYTSWDYNHDAVARYYNESLHKGVAIDGRNDDSGNIDKLPGFGPAFFDAPDPRFTKPLAFLNWEEVSGRRNNGSLVYIFEIKAPQGLLNPAVVPYYRDDACFDDGTGDDPSPRPNPGEPYSSPSFSRAEAHRPCFTRAPDGYRGPYRQGAFGSHGVHYFLTLDTDNAFGPKPLTEIDGQQWQFTVPTAAPANIGNPYANTVKLPLVPRTTFRPGRSGS